MQPRGAILLLSGLAVAGCHSSGGGSGTGTTFTSICSPNGSPGATPAQACSAFVDAVTAWGGRCLQSSLDLGGDDFRDYCNRLLAAPGTNNAPGALAACAAKLRDLSCDKSVDDICECNNLDNVGTLPSGSACADSLQCASRNCAGRSNGGDLFTCGHCATTVPVGGDCSGMDARCAIGSSCSRGKCVADIVANEGETCESAGGGLVRCASGLRCGHMPSDAGGSYVCLRESAEGAPCGVCASGLHCDQGICRPRADVGAACMSSSDCKPEVTCDYKAGHCAAITMLSADQACDLSAPTSRCGPDLYCTSTTSNQPGVCKAFKHRGEPCVPGQDHCSTYTTCLNGACVTPDPSSCR